jgi:hypothetical protein
MSFQPQIKKSVLKVIIWKKYLSLFHQNQTKIPVVYKVSFYNLCFSFKRFTFLAHSDTAGQVGPAQGCSQIKGNWSLVQDVCASALELSVLLDALKARQRSCVAFGDGFKKDLTIAGISCIVF